MTLFRKQSAPAVALVEPEAPPKLEDPTADLEALVSEKQSAWKTAEDAATKTKERLEKLGLRRDSDLETESSDSPKVAATIMEILATERQLELDLAKRDRAEARFLEVKRDLDRARETVDRARRRAEAEALLAEGQAAIEAAYDFAARGAEQLQRRDELFARLRDEYSDVDGVRLAQPLLSSGPLLQAARKRALARINSLPFLSLRADFARLIW